MKKILFILLSVLLLCSCEKSAQDNLRTTNKEIEVEFLFEVDGISVYRFYDFGRAVYFTNRKGETTYTDVVATGKSSYIHTVQCLNE